MTGNGESRMVCPQCSTVVDLNERCPSERGVGRCVERAGHDGWHWSDVGAHPAVLRWTGLYSVRSCPGRLDLRHWCSKPAGHDGSHTENGISWGEDHDISARFEDQAAYSGGSSS